MTVRGLHTLLPCSSKTGLLPVRGSMHNKRLACALCMIAWGASTLVVLILREESKNHARYLQGRCSPWHTLRIYPGQEDSELTDEVTRCLATRQSVFSGSTWSVSRL
jgi:hypothetical protein